MGGQRPPAPPGARDRHHPPSVPRTPTPRAAPAPLGRPLCPVRPILAAFPLLLTDGGGRVNTAAAAPGAQPRPRALPRREVMSLCLLDWT
ncbi:uncharacterized protein LOC110211258 isoform X2 [Phascolarctos cinereus]